MGFRSNIGFENLSLDLLREIEELATRFESELSQSRNPRLEDYLNQASPEIKKALLGELILLELEYQQKEFSPSLISSYLKRFREHPEVVEQVLTHRAERDSRQSTISSRALESSRISKISASAPDELENSKSKKKVWIRDYYLIKKLGEGGMGTVYLAIHSLLEKRVALKLLRLDRNRDSKYISRFEAEMKAIGNLKHANIVAATDAGEVGGRYYLAMEYIEGVDLAKLIKRLGPLSIADACEIIAQASEALHHAHSTGWIHRDVKPSNLMVSSSGDVKLLDLGLAVATAYRSADSKLTQEGQVVGTPLYMAPETFDDERSVDSRADLYGLGIVFAELLTGLSPRDFTADNSSRMEALTSRTDLPSDLLAVIIRMLDHEPSKRMASAQEVSERIDAHRSNSNLKALFERYETRLQWDLSQTKRVDRGSSNQTAPALLPSSTATHQVARSWQSVAVWLSIALGGLSFLVASVALLLIFFGRGTSSVPASDLATIRIREYPAGVVVGDRGLLDRDTKLVYSLGIGDTDIPAGTYVLVDEAGTILDQDEINLFAGETLVLSLPAEVESEVEPSQPTIPFVPYLPNEPGFFARYATTIVQASESGEMQTTHPYVVVTLLGNEIKDGSQLVWIKLEVMDESRHEFAVLSIDRESLEREHRFVVRAGWVGFTIPDWMKRMKDALGPTLVVPFEADRDLITEQIKAWGYTINERRINVHDAMALLYEMSPLGAQEAVRKLRGAIDVATDRLEESVESPDPLGGAPIDCQVVDVNCESMFVPVRLRTRKEARPRRIPLGVVHVQHKSDELETTLNLVDYGRHADVESFVSHVSQMTSAATKTVETDVPTPPDFAKATLPTVAGSWSTLLGSLSVGSRASNFELTLKSLGSDDFEGLRIHWIDIKLTAGSASDVAHHYIVAIDEQSYMERQDFVWVAGWEIVGDLKIDLEWNASLRNQILEWKGVEVSAPPIQIEDVLVLMFDAKGLSSTSKLAVVRAQVANELVIREMDRQKQESEKKTRTELVVRGMEWRLEPDEGKLGAAYRIMRSENVPFYFVEVFLSVPPTSPSDQNSMQLNAKLNDFGVLPVGELPKIDAYRAAFEQTTAELEEREIRAWRDNTDRIFGIHQYKDYVYQRSRRRFMVQVEDVDGKLQLVDPSLLDDEHRTWLVQKAGQSWELSDGSKIMLALPVSWQSPDITLWDPSLMLIRLRRTDDTSTTDIDAIDGRLSYGEWRSLRERLETTLRTVPDDEE